MTMLGPFAANTLCYQRQPLEVALEGIAAAGFRHVELCLWPHVRPDMTDAQLRKLDTALARRDLAIVSISGHSDLTTADGVDYCNQAIDFAARRSVAVLTTAIGGHASNQEDEQAFLRSIGGLVERASDRGVTLALEIHGDLMANGERSIALFERIGHPALKINYDTGNCIFHGDTMPYGDLEACLPFLGHVHLKDKRGGKGVWDFPAVGEGTIDFARVLRILSRGGYEGPLSVEIEFTPDAEPSRTEVDAAVATSFETIERVRSALAGADAPTR